MSEVVQSKYKIGQKLKKNTQVTFEGNQVSVSVDHFIIGIRALSSDVGFYYEYTLGSSFPSAHHEPGFKTNVSGQVLDKFYE
jgi:hypothetical protein